MKNLDAQNDPRLGDAGIAVLRESEDSDGGFVYLENLGELRYLPPGMHIYFLSVRGCMNLIDFPDDIHVDSVLLCNVKYRARAEELMALGRVRSWDA